MTRSIGSGQKEFLMARRNQLAFKPTLSETVSFPETFGYLYDAFEIGQKCNTKGRERGCRQSLYRGTSFSLHSTQNI